MNAEHDVICYKIVTGQQVDVDRVEFPAISEPVLKVIREAKLQSLQGLLGDNWRSESRRLAKEYWGVK